MSDDYEWPRSVPEKPEPWWNNSDRVSGLLATITLITVVLCICILLIGLAIKLAF